MSIFKDSFREFKNIRSLTACAMLMALTLVISSFTIQVSSYIKIGFSFLATELAYMFFGPVVGAVFGGAADVFSYIIKPTGAYFFGFTLSGILAGLIYGIGFYKKPVSFTRVFIVKAIAAVLINMLLGTYWLTMLYGKGFMVLFPARVIKNLVMLPINSIMFYTLAKTLEKTPVLNMIRIRDSRADRY